MLIADNNQPAVKVANLSTYIMSEFYVYNLDKDGTETYTWFDAVPCDQYFSQIFGGPENIPETLKKELIGVLNSEWLCPDMPVTGGAQFQLQNNPFQYNYGTNLNYVTNFCYVSALRKGVVDPNCVTDQTELYNYIDSTRVSHKFVRQFFNPNTALNSGVMDYIGEQRMESDFSQVITPTNYFLSQANTVSFYDNKVFDFSSFSFIPVDYYDFYST